MKDKPLAWIGSSLDDLRGFPDSVRRRAGFELRAVQRGLTPSDFKSMPTVGPGTYELRLRTREAHRVFYVARFEEAVYILHAFQKKSQKTSQKDLERGRQRYREMLAYREQHKNEKDS